MSAQANKEMKPKIEGRRRNALIAFNILLALVTAIGLVAMIALGPYHRPSSDGPLALSRINASQLRSLILSTLITMILAGSAGGTLCNLRGLFKHIRDGKDGSFPESLEAPFYVRPFTGAVTGLFSFFVASFFATSLTIEASSLSWVTLTGRFPFIAIAILAGFAAQEFMQKLKELAKNVFSHSTEA